MALSSCMGWEGWCVFQIFDFGGQMGRNKRLLAIYLAHEVFYVSHSSFGHSSLNEQSLSVE